ncbi:hypothetical protein GCM10007424_11650 [Flavobacterium suaedae]|uniref:Prepilin-type N-terminal cleavage/methylation domain-containing protein n=1 Tax=Flavobacterium suaedae TaxID=1767027 RepID=A0ABQ1JPY0_9FLAO|nr:prepilin-type N-terminal cleavage/methylation domain-containing protein [Flavobacterium suaedae]GGB73407.1 hypothetical protein GCM10007424_11650 [Flavobacterium suaedae]
MASNKVKSFTLSEMLVVMIITAIVVGIAFSVLNLVQRQISGIEKNFSKTTALSLFEQRLWADFNRHNNIIANSNTIIFVSDVDTVLYTFNENHVLRNTDTINTKLITNKFYYLGKEVQSGTIDAVLISAGKEMSNYSIFASMEHDASYFMNNDGF